MDGLVEFAIPVSGLSDGLHTYAFRVGAEFFSAFEGSPIGEADLQVDVDFEKRPDMYLIGARHHGTVRTTCDRCMEVIDLPVEGRLDLVVKFSAEELPEEADVVYMHPEITSLNIARYLYESIVLSLPLIKVYDCASDEEAPCDPETLRYLDQNGAADSPEEDVENNPFREALKHWKKNH